MGSQCGLNRLVSGYSLYMKEFYGGYKKVNLSTSIKTRKNAKNHIGIIEIVKKVRKRVKSPEQR